MNKQRCFRLIENAISSLELDLSGFSILTEAATGYYSLTPVIAAMAGADSVLAITRGSRFGSEETVRTLLHELSADCGTRQIDVIADRHDPRINGVDIVTNLGFVRPIDRELLSLLKEHAVVSLMWEPWEFRESDIDLPACRDIGIPILGTNEDDPRLQTGRYVGHLAAKLLLERSIELLMSRIVVVGSGKFGMHVCNTLTALGAEIRYVNGDTDESLGDDAVLSKISRADAMVFTEHCHDRSLVGPSGQIEARKILELNPSLTLIHICGHIDQLSLNEAGFEIHPEHPAEFGFMTVATDYLGPRPLIDLHAAGLKVGAELADCRRQGMQWNESERTAAAQCNLAAQLKLEDCK